jgi:hypothetical protein
MILRQAQTFAFLFSPWRAPPAARRPYRASGLVQAQMAAMCRWRCEWVKSTRTRSRGRAHEANSPTNWPSGRTKQGMERVEAGRYPGLCTATSAMSFSREPHRRPRWRPWSASEPPPRARYPSSGHSCCETPRPRDAIWLRSRGVRRLLCVLDWAWWVSGCPGNFRFATSSLNSVRSKCFCCL